MTKLTAIIVALFAGFIVGVLEAHIATGEIEQTIIAIILIAGSSFLTWVCICDSLNQRNTWNR